VGKQVGARIIAHVNPQKKSPDILDLTPRLWGG